MEFPNDAAGLKSGYALWQARISLSIPMSVCKVTTALLLFPSNSEPASGSRHEGYSVEPRDFWEMASVRQKLVGWGMKTGGCGSAAT